MARFRISSGSIPEAPGYQLVLEPIKDNVPMFDASEAIQIRIRDGSQTGQAEVYFSRDGKVCKQVYEKGITKLMTCCHNNVLTLPTIDRASGQLLVLDSNLSARGQQVVGLKTDTIKN